MKRFVIFGDIYFTDDVALVNSVKFSGFFEPDAIENEAEKYGGDWLEPHYYNGKVIFAKYQEEKWI
jgi:hypothetical protein